MVAGAAAAVTAKLSEARDAKHAGSARHALNPRSMSMSSFRTLLILAVTFLTGCASVHKSSTETREYAEQGISVNSVQLVGTSLVSFGRLSGENEREIDRLETVSNWSRPGLGDVRFSVPSFTDENRSAAMRQFLESGAHDFLTALAEALSSLDAIHQSTVDLSVVLAEQGSGSYYSSRGRVARTLPVSIIYFQPGDDTRMKTDGREATAWWAGLIRSVTHELYHLHQRLSDLDSTQLDGEAAATIVEACSLIQYAKQVGADPTIDVHWIQDDPRTSSIFRGLEEGQLNVDLDRLEAIGGVSLQGQVLGTAVLSLLSSSKTITLGASEEIESIFRYCDQLSRQVPKFHAGDW